MGLDLVHAAPSTSGLDYLTIDELVDIPDYLEKYKHFITEVEVEN